MKKTRLPVILATSLWTIASLSVLVLNLSATKPDSAPIRKAWWLGQTIGDLRASKELLSKIEKSQIEANTFVDFGALKTIFDKGGDEIIALFALVNLEGVDGAKPFEASSFDPRGFGSLSPGPLSLVGSSITSLARFDISNLDKLSWVKLGQELMDLAVQRDGRNPVPHIVRYYNNEALPDFLKRPDLSAADVTFVKGGQ